MNINEQPIAIPKKGKVIANVLKSNSATPDNIKIKSKLKKATVKPNKSLVTIVTGVRTTSQRADMLASIKNGLQFTSIKTLEHAFGATQKEIAKVLSIPPSTLTRRQKAGSLHPDESDRVVRLARIKDAALTLMQDNNEAAITWLRTPLPILGGETPFEYASTELGARDVEDLIGRLRHGVFS